MPALIELSIWYSKALTQPDNNAGMAVSGPSKVARIKNLGRTNFQIIQVTLDCTASSYTPAAI